MKWLIIVSLLIPTPVLASPCSDARERFHRAEAALQQESVREKEDFLGYVIDHDRLKKLHAEGEEAAKRYMSECMKGE